MKFFDLGLLPRQIFSMRKPEILTTQDAAQQSKNVPQSVRETLSANELQWLDDGKFVELESFTTQRIIRGITQAIAKSQDPDRADSLVELEDDHSYVTYSDSFG